MGKRGCPSQSPPDDSGTSKTTKHRVSTTEQIIAKKIADNFKGWSAEMIDCRKSPVDGKTLRDKITADLPLAQDGKLTMGKFYYRDLRNEYQGPTEAHKALEPEMPKLDVNPKLLKAAAAALDPNRPDRKQIQQYLATCEVPNKTEICLIFRFFLKLKPTVENQLHVCVHACRFMRRLDLPCVFADKFAIIKFWVDEVLCKLLAQSRAGKKDEDDSRFIDSQRSLLSLVLPGSHLETVIGHKGPMLEVKEAVIAVVEAGRVGQVMFRAAVESILSEEVTTKANEAVQKTLASSRELTEEVIRLATIKLTQDLEQMPSISCLPSKRETLVPYRGHLLKVEVRSIGEDVAIRYAAAFKSLAVEQKSLTECWGESAMSAATVGPVQACKVEAGLVQQASHAREALKTELEDAGANSGDIVKEVLRKKSSYFLGIDPHFHVSQVAFLEILIFCVSCYGFGKPWAQTYVVSWASLPVRGRAGFATDPHIHQCQALRCYPSVLAIYNQAGAA